jgi:CDP-diacylglycerol pyrophosphatase
MNVRYRVLVGILIGVVALICVIGYAYLRAVSNPNALWVIVQSCVTQAQSGRLMPGSCVAIDQPDQVAILRSIEGRNQFLLVPTRRVSGIEDPYILEPSAPHYWSLAWAAAERYLPPGVRKDRTRIGLAINSVYGRSQAQLHIHISCIKQNTIDVLETVQRQIGPTWSAPAIELGGHDYRAMRISGKTLGSADPFQLAIKIPGAAGHMGAHTLVLVGASWDNGAHAGFYLLDDVAHTIGDDVDRGHGEALLDENCAGR